MLIERIPAYNPGPYTGAGNNTYLVRGREPALVDAGTGDPRHLDRLARALAVPAGGGSRGTATLARVLVTHAHPDHASGATAIAARWPDATLAKMPWPEHDARYPARWHALADGDLVPAGDGALRVVHTPGHAPDHLCFFEERSGVLFSGDLVVSGSTVMIPASAGGSLTAYLASLRRALALRPRRLLPAHGPAIDAPEAIVRRYLAHRARREADIIGTFDAGVQTVDRIVSCVYTNLAPGLAHAARESVRAHLDKLESDGIVARDGETWRRVVGH